MKIGLVTSYVCGACERRYRKDDTEFVYKKVCLCKKCAKKLIPYSDDAYVEAVGGIEFLKPIFEYKGIYREMFLKFKFNSQLAYGHVLGMAAADRIKVCTELGDYDYIVPVPTSRRRYCERGYNQSEILAEYVSEALGIPILKALKRVKHSVPQSRVGTGMRYENVHNAFVSNVDLAGKNVIVFDDIYTTGSTASECAKALYKSGAGRICVLASAYNIRRENDSAIHRFV